MRNVSGWKPELLEYYMQLEPKDIFESLEFDKIIELLEARCLGELGQQRMRNISIETNKTLIEMKLRETHEYKLSMEENDNFPIRKYEAIDKDLRMLEVVDFVLPVEGLQRINTVLRQVQAMFKFFNEPKIQLYPTMYNIVKVVTFDPALLKAIDKVIDVEGSIKPDASPALQKIRRSINNKMRELDKSFKHILAEYRQKGWLADTSESVRNGRRVLAVNSEHKRKIRGIIHDESSTGRTAFIEPDQILAINNDIFDFETEEKREIYRILKDLSTTLRPYSPLFKKYQSIIIRFDLIRAKADLAREMRGVMPKILPKPTLGIQMGRHPLLYLKNKKLGKETVPFDCELHGDNRIVVLSGPNAGGKSILMKSVGLLQLMLQSGLLIPVDEISKMGIFEKFFADIGDQQSLEDDLSTYSSRLKNAKSFLENADKKTLILIDEFGSGTDPKIGGAIAEAVLLKLNEKRAFGVITTHYSNLKMFAFKTDHIVNGSMIFDKDNLAPTYQFKVGRPGSSYAFEIARKIGLQEDVLKYARQRTGKNEKAVDELLIDLQREKQELGEKLASASSREKALEKLIKSYADLQKDLEYRRKKFKLELKEKAMQETGRDNKQLEKVIREIRENQNLDAAKKMAVQAREDREQLSQQVSGLRNDIYYTDEPKYVKKGEIREGDYVKMRSGGATGQVEKIKKKNATIVMGSLRMEVKLRDLQPANEPLEVKSSKSINTDTVGASAAFESEIDLRGMMPSEAMRTLEEFVDNALISSAMELRIVHGKGTGVLRQVVKNKLKEYKDVTGSRHPKANEGGDGVTIVELG
ncbi:MAG: DNA mismatch repair protein MutS2 [Saprospiraceae bacterium]|jgi:DNA mismatch repair protein MutS2